MVSTRYYINYSVHLKRTFYRSFYRRDCRLWFSAFTSFFLMFLHFTVSVPLVVLLVRRFVSPFRVNSDGTVNMRSENQTWLKRNWRHWDCTGSRVFYGFFFIPRTISELLVGHPEVRSVSSDVFVSNRNVPV